MIELGSYRIDCECGRGGMSVVYSATHLSLRTRHAIKVFAAESGRNKKALCKKFLAEARILATVRHPNIARVTDFGTMDDGRAYLVMDYVEGTTLAARLANPVPLSRAELDNLYSAVRSALAYCHSRGIVHGDVKAENILLTATGDAVLGDFGIARIVNPTTRKGLELTATADIGNLGTPYTLAPECRAGALATAQSDVYSFGVVLFKALTGIWYEGSPRLLAQLKSIDPANAPLVRTMLSDDLCVRPESAAALPLRLLPEKRHFRQSRLINAAAIVLGLVSSVFLLLGAGMAYERGKAAGDGVDALPILASSDELILRGGSVVTVNAPVHVGRLVLPDSDAVVRIKVPDGYDGLVLSADDVDGSLDGQVQIVRPKGRRVIYRANNEIVVRQP